MTKTTSRLEVPVGESLSRSSQPEGLDLGIFRPWRIALIISAMPAQLIIDLQSALTVGRKDAHNSVFPDVDLSPFDAEKLGVSRRHMVMRRESAGIVIVDNHSSNGTRLNGHLLVPDQPHAIKHGDKIALGALTMEIAVLINPLD